MAAIALHVLAVTLAQGGNPWVTARPRGPRGGLRYARLAEKPRWPRKGGSCGRSDLDVARKKCSSSEASVEANRHKKFTSAR